MEWAARAIGMFYVLGGLMLLYQAWLNWRLQRALSGLIPVSVTDQVGDGVIALGGLAGPGLGRGPGGAQRLGGRGLPGRVDDPGPVSAVE
jgi:hypothetical protein